MGLADIRRAIRGAVDALNLTTDGRVLYRFHNQKGGIYEVSAQTVGRLYRVRLAGPVRASRWTRGAGLDVAEADLALDLAHPASAFPDVQDLDDVIAADTVAVMNAVRNPAIWSSVARNLVVRPEPQAASLTGTNDAVVTTITTLSIGVEYATGA